MISISLTHKLKKISARLFRPAAIADAPTVELCAPLPLPAIRPVMTALTKERMEALLAEDDFYFHLKRMSN